MKDSGAYLSGMKRQLEGGAFGIGKITWRPVSSDKAQMTQAGEALGAIIHLATKTRSFLVLDMPPDDGGLEVLERQLRAAPAAKVVWTQAGRALNLNALPGYGHGLLRALSLRHAGLLFTLTQDPPAPADSPLPRKNHLYDPGGVFSREWRAHARSARGAFHRRERFLSRWSCGLCGKDSPFSPKRPREYQPARPEGSSPTGTHGGFSRTAAGSPDSRNSPESVASGRAHGDNAASRGWKHPEQMISR